MSHLEEDFRLDLLTLGSTPSPARREGLVRMTAEVEVVGIVVPARNEEDLLPAALRALDRAAQPVLRRGVVVDLLVVADSCTDATVRWRGPSGSTCSRCPSVRSGRPGQPGSGPC